MSPRRMDISSLLRDPSPPRDDCHPLPASLLTILNSPQDPPPFLGLDALVHVASEERRRISAASHHPDLLSLAQDDARPHKRPRSPPRSPSPISTSPTTRLHPSAITAYPTLGVDPTLSPNDPRPSSLYTSPFPQLRTHPSPRNTSPHRLSPQLLRPQHYSSPIHSASPDPDVMSPRYGYGPRMAGGIQVLSADPSPVRNPPRPNFSFYQSPGRDLSAERLLSDSHADHPRHDPPNLSPLSSRSFSFADDKRHSITPSHKVDGQDTMVLRERVRPRPHLPFLDAMDSHRNMAHDTDLLPQHPRERHPIRVWEEQPTSREPPRHVSPVHIHPHPELRAWSAASVSGYGDWPTKDGRAMSRRVVAENVHVSPFSTDEPPPPPRHPTPESLPGLHTSVERTRLSPPPSLPIPTQFEPHTRPAQTPRPSSPTTPMSASPVLDVFPNNFEAQSALQAALSELQADASASVSPTPSDPIVTQLASDIAEPMHVCADADAGAGLIADPLSPQPSPGPVQPVTALKSGSEVTTHADVSQSKSRSPTQQPLPVSLPAKLEHGPIPEDPLVSPPIPPGPAPVRSAELKHTAEREPPASEQIMMDVDEEVLSLVEDRPAFAAPAVPKVQIDSESPPHVTAVQATGASVDQSREVFDGLSSMPSSQPILKGPLTTDEDKDRASMPPPAARSRKAEKDKTSPAAGAATGSKKKKDGTSKLVAKPKQPPKPRAKPAPKPKAKPNVVDSSLKAGIPKGAVNLNARSRSTSIIPAAVEDIVPEPEPDDCDKEDDKLYCICKTRYDEDRMMIACDRCDEWFHTMCVDMPDLEIELVDQFICPPCLEKQPHLRTTWKRRCLLGVQHENPTSPEACHKPSRGAFSKYCSDECGVKAMQARITQWEKSGGARDLLWESVKNAAKREGVVVCAATNGARMTDVDTKTSESKSLDSVAKRRAEREVTRLNACLEKVVKERELMKRDLDMVIWRKKVVELASERAAKVDECGWDQRLCFGEEEWADFGEEVLESYEDEQKADPEDDAMPRDAASAAHGEWWCTGKKKCERHAGWQKLRAGEVSFDKETKEAILLKLTTREREIRKRIEDILYPQPTGTLKAPPPGVQLNGTQKPRSTDHILEKGRKRS